MVLRLLDTTCKIMNLDPFLIPHTKINLKSIKYQIVALKLQLLEGNREIFRKLDSAIVF